MNRDHPPRVNFHIRLAEAKDLCAMVKLLEVLFRVEPDFSIDPERQRKGLTLLLNHPDTARLWVAEMAGRVVGMVSLQLLADRGNGAALVFYQRLSWHGSRMVVLRRRLE